jgi:hypothetical protein
MPRQDANPGKIPRKTKWLLFLGIVIALILVVGATLLALKWPFSERELVESIQEVVPAGKVEIASFETSVFPHPGCDARNVVVRASDDPSSPPLATAQRISVQARYPDLFLRPGYIKRVVLNGLVVKMPSFGSRGKGKGGSPSSNNASSDTRIGELVTNGARLEIARADSKPPLIFQIHSLALKSVSRDRPFSFDAALTNALPPGEIVSHGQMGPWNRAEWGKTPVSGSARFEKADLNALAGIGGTLSSEDRFEGTLERIGVTGTAVIPDFVVKMGGHPNDVRARYRVEVNATNGDVLLQNAETTITKTTIVASGKIAGQPGAKGKTTSLDLQVKKGRIQDVLNLFVSDPNPPLDAATDFQASVQVPPQGRPFLKELDLRGGFRIENGRFTKPDTQRSITDLSLRARGQTHGNAAARPEESVLAEMNATVNTRAGIAHFTDLFFRIPGAVAHMDGNYDLVTQKIDFHGSLRTQAELSQTTNGVKSALLKPFNWIFKRKHAGAEIPVQMTGTYQNPHFATDPNPVEALKKK